MACALRWRALALGRAGRWLRWRWRWRRLRWNWKHHSCLLKIPEIPGIREIREMQDIRGIQGTLVIQENRDIRNSQTTLMGQKRIPGHLKKTRGPAGPAIARRSALWSAVVALTLAWRWALAAPALALALAARAPGSAGPTKVQAGPRLGLCWDGPRE